MVKEEYEIITLLHLYLFSSVVIVFSNIFHIMACIENGNVWQIGYLDEALYSA